MKPSSFLCGVGYSALLAAMAQTALADDLVVGNTTVLNTPLATATAANGTPGNITLDLGSRVSVDNAGSTLTLNYDNTFIDVSGMVEATANSGAIGVHLLGGYHGTFTSRGSAGAIINVTGSGTGNYGLLLDGSAPFIGNILLESGSSVILYGEGSVGVAINAPVEGDLLMGSSIQATGVGTTGVLVTSNIAGSYTNSGAIQVRGITTYTSDKVDPLSGSGIAIGASITSGFLNSGAVSASDSSTVTGSVTNSSTAPALVIAPSISGSNASNITIGAFAADTAGLNFSFINRGTLIASENDAGISTTGVRFGETGNASFSVSLVNGIYNRGSIQSSSESDNANSTSASAVATNAIGLEIGNGVIVSSFTAPIQTVSAATWETTAGTGSTSTTIVLGDDASDVDGIYNGFVITTGGETQVITDYDVTFDDDGAVVSKIATLASPLTSAPAADVALTIAASPTDSIGLGETASEISGSYTGLTITTSNQTFVISDYVVIYNPTTSEPTMKVATIEGLNGLPATWATVPTTGDNVSITSSSLFNAGSITASMGGTHGGVVTSLLIQPGGTLPSLTNVGAIDATATTSDATISTLSAIAINDLSGTLNTIVNTGRISANVTPLTGGTQVGIAADLSHSTQPQDFFVFGGGEVTGDILFGSSTSHLTIEGYVTRTLADDTTVIDKAQVTGALSAVGGGTLAIDISKLGTGGVLRTTNVRAANLFVGEQGVVQFALTKNATSSPIIATTGNVTFSGNTSIELTPTSFLPAASTYTLITTSGPGGLSFSDFAATSNLAIPYLFKGSFSTDGGPLDSSSQSVTAQDLYLTLTRKTATELGLQANAAAVYEPLVNAALEDDEFGAALLTLTTSEEVNDAVQSAVPDIAGGMRALAIAMTDQATGVIGARQRSLLSAPAGTRNGSRFWAQEFYNIVADDGSIDQPGFGGAGLGVAVGVEWGALQTRRYGLGYTFFSSQETERHPRDTKTNGDWNMLSAYAAWRVNNLYIAPQLNIGAGAFKSRRSIVVGDTFGRSATADWSGYLAAGGITAGYMFNLGNFQIIPTLALDLTYLNQGAYEEVGGGGVGLSLEAQNYASVRNFVGLMVQRSYPFNEGAFTPQLLVGWSHEFLNDPATIDGWFESSSTSPFHLVGPTLSADKIVGGMNLSYVMRNWSVGFNYDAAANSGTLSQSATVSLTTRF